MSEAYENKYLNLPIISANSDKRNLVDSMNTTSRFSRLVKIKMNVMKAKQQFLSNTLFKRYNTLKEISKKMDLERQSTSIKRKLTWLEEGPELKVF